MEGRLLSGSAGPLLAEVSEEFDLMVVGSRGYGALKRTALGSVAGKLVNSAACPVLVLPRGAGMDPLGLKEAEAAARERLSTPELKAGPGAEAQQRRQCLSRPLSSPRAATKRSSIE